MKSHAIISLLFAGICSILTTVGQDVEEAFRTDIETLAADRMQGREAGTEGEQLAAEFIITRYQSLGLAPKGNEGKYTQPFKFKAGAQLGPANTLTVGQTAVALDSGFYPLPYSANGKASGALIKAGFGIKAPDLDYDDYAGLTDLKGKIFVLEVGSPDGIHPHSKYAEYHPLEYRIDIAIEAGAAGVIFVNSDANTRDPSRRLISRKLRSPIPVVFATGEQVALLKPGATASLEVEVVVEYRTGKNVVGYLDNGAENTVVIGAHYDHLGMGDAGSLHRGEPAIHNGADDNASGIAMMLALAAHSKQAGNRQYNYAFIAFSGEEKGLLGSNHFCKNPTFDLGKVNYMINLDMVGRLDPQENKMGINGVGTSPTWNDILPTIEVADLYFKTSESGVGPSDHTSFYLVDVPVLHFFSGTHKDYHKPSDDTELINFEGMDKIYRYIAGLMDALEGREKLAFTQTKNESNENAPRFTVTLGVIPDYLFDGEGMRIDGVTEGKPGSNAGVQAGDVVIRMGDVKVMDMMSYMKGLGQFKKGDKTNITVRRGEKEIEMDVQF